MVIPHFRWDRLANVFIILAYVPFLLLLPVLLVVGLVFVVVPGGFIVVLGGLYYAAAGLVGLLGLAARQRRQAGASRDGHERRDRVASRPIVIWATGIYRPEAERHGV